MGFRPPPSAGSGSAATTTFAPSGSIAATNVQAAIEEVRDEAGAGGVPSGTDGQLLGYVGTTPTALDVDTAVTPADIGAAAASDLTDHTSDASGAHAATAISFTPAGTIAATTVQAAIEEVASEAGGGGGGTAATFWTPEMNDLLAAMFDPAANTSQSAGTSGRIDLIKVPCPEAISVTAIKLLLSVAGSGLVAGQCLAAIYDPATPAAAPRLAQTGDQSGVWNSLTPVEKTMALTGGPVSISSSLGFVYVALLAVQSGGAMPQFRHRSSPAATVLNAGLTMQRSRAATYGAVSSFTAMPATVDLTGAGSFAMAQVSTEIWVGLV